MWTAVESELYSALTNRSTDMHSAIRAQVQSTILEQQKAAIEISQYSFKNFSYVIKNETGIQKVNTICCLPYKSKCNSIKLI